MKKPDLQNRSNRSSTAFKADLRKQLERGFSSTEHSWKYCWLRLQDNSLGRLEKQWIRFQYQMLGLRLELVRVRA